jgi:hypothetical protein
VGPAVQGTPTIRERQGTEGIYGMRHEKATLAVTPSRETLPASQSAGVRYIRTLPPQAPHSWEESSFLSDTPPCAARIRNGRSPIVVGEGAQSGRKDNSLRRPGRGPGSQTGSPPQLTATEICYRTCHCIPEPGWRCGSTRVPLSGYRPVTCRYVVRFLAYSAFASTRRSCVCCTIACASRRSVMPVTP